MQNLNRRRVLTLGAALGLDGAATPGKGWAWSPANSLAATNIDPPTNIDPAPNTDPATDPWSVWDDATDPLVASLLDGGQIPAVNTAFESWVDNGDVLPAGLPANLVTYLRQ